MPCFAWPASIPLPSWWYPAHCHLGEVVVWHVQYVACQKLPVLPHCRFKLVLHIPLQYFFSCDLNMVPTPIILCKQLYWNTLSFFMILNVIFHISLMYVAIGVMRVLYRCILVLRLIVDIDQVQCSLWNINNPFPILLFTSVSTLPPRYVKCLTLQLSGDQ